MLIVGCVVAFIVAILAMKWFVAFLTKYGFKAFGWYRIVVGIFAGDAGHGYDLNMVG
jgi:undecaprenyl-diphosphatase